ncbi:MAG: hypothetical protein HY764_01130 [Candidatus Portnoybacteria bacterium]|nr:hypothetical protein [Candidatus Portnoybacteria bacterium]
MDNFNLRRLLILFISAIIKADKIIFKQRKEMPMFERETLEINKEGQIEKMIEPFLHEKSEEVEDELRALLGDEYEQWRVADFFEMQNAQ